MNRYAIISGDFVTTGGMDRANYALADYLSRQGDAVELVAHRIAPELAGRPNVIHHRVAKPLNSYLLASPLLNVRGRREARRIHQFGGRVIVNGGNCTFGDVNWVHYLHVAYRPQVQASRLRRLKAMIERPLSLKAERKALRRARIVIANSELTRRTLLEKFDLPPDRVKTIYYGIDAERFRPASESEKRELRTGFGWTDDRPRIMFIGALGDRRKGFDTVAEAWKMLVLRHQWDGVLTVVGSGAEAHLWRARLEAEGLGGHVEFLGRRSDVPDLLRAADALVAPTRYEAYGLGVHEALCCGLPAFVSADAGVAERYPAELRQLLLPDANDALDLVQRLAMWRNGSTQISSLISRVSESLRRRTWDSMASDIDALVNA